MAKTTMKLNSSVKLSSLQELIHVARICGRPHAVLRNTEFAEFASVS